MSAMTRQEQIDAVFELLAPPTDQRGEREHDLAQTFDRIDREVSFTRAHRVLASKGKGGVVNLLTALLRLQEAYGALDPKLKPWFSLPHGIDREIATAKAFTEQSPHRVHYKKVVYRAATRAAYDLLIWWGDEPVTTRNGLWDELAAILSGDLDLDMFEYLREHKSGPVPRVARVRDPEGGVAKISIRRM
jgi:hypothetical protein